MAVTSERSNGPMVMARGVEATLTNGQLAIRVFAGQQHRAAQHTTDHWVIAACDLAPSVAGPERTEIVTPPGEVISGHSTCVVGTASVERPIS